VDGTQLLNRATMTTQASTRSRPSEITPETLINATTEQAMFQRAVPPMD
jgi:hypothetical protein